MTNNVHDISSAQFFLHRNVLIICTDLFFQVNFKNGHIVNISLNFYDEHEEQAGRW